jgi:hypothetical protein
MERFLKRHRGRHSGSITGFDRLLFRGVLRSISYVEGLNYFMGNQRVPFKGFKAFVERFSAGVRRRAEGIAKRARRPFLYLAASRTDKEKLVREVMQRDRIKGGLVCVLACVEPCQSFSVRSNREKRELQLVARERKCLHLYFYLLNREFGLAHIRRQTWLPLSIQVCVNGREWPARQMKRRNRVRTERQLLYLDSRSFSGASPDGPASGIPLGEVVEPLGAVGKPVAEAPSPSSTARLLLDGAAKRMRHGRDVSQPGSVGGDLSRAVPARR